MSYVNVQGRRRPFVVRYAADLLSFRHLAWNLVGSDLRSRFRRSYLGVLWAIIQPLCFALTIAAVWRSVFNMPDYWDFAIYLFSGILLWDYFSSTVLVSQDSFSAAEGYLRQTRIPLFVFQIRAPLTGMVVLIFGIMGLFGLQAVLGKFPPPGLHLLLIPAFLALFLMFAFGISMICSVVGTQFRDMKYISAVVVQGLFFLSPVMLDRGILTRPELSFLQFVNPMTPMIDLFRAPVLRGELWPPQELYTALIWIAALWVAGLILSARTGRRIVFAL